ncbi:hypothetical protein BG011_005163 [Mortierella polycephala]|uniref:Uncharacterized protein n=1 Tax=Mortierella polycephala TaxID=41804 RepID=A0A9P6PWS7_9FUNG|nr:hypothetical protein BG011_005163 [Mortierella polycephala]
MTKKNKINKLVRNPFTNTRQTSDRIEDTASGNEDDDEDDDDEERVIRARRDTLVALDPNNKDSRNAKFKYLSAKAQRMRAQTNAFEQQQRQASTQLQYQLYAQEEHGQHCRALLDQQTVLSDHVQGMTERQDDANDRSGNNLLCAPKSKKIDELVPEIYISLPTPSPPTSKQKNRHESSLGNTNPLLLSTTFTPSPLSLSSRDPLEDSALNIPLGRTRARSNRSSNVYKSLFQRFTGSPAPPELDANEITDQSPSVVEANQPIVQPSSTSWPLNRNTFGAPIKSALADRGHQSRSTGWRPSRTPRVGRTEKHDPWDSCDDMLMETTDDENVDNPTSCWREESQLKGRIGVGERRLCDDMASEDIQSSVIPRLGRGALDGWIAQPRAAAIWGTANKIDDAVPVPKQQPRPQSLPSDHTVIDLMPSPERAHHSPTAAGTAVILTRAGSLGSSFNRLQRSPPSMTADLDLPSSLDIRTDRTMKMENRVQGASEKAQQEVYDTTGDREWHSINKSIDRSDQRSSSRTFGPTHRSKVTPPPATLSSFSSLRDLVTSAVRLNRSCSATDDTSLPTYSPSAYLRRSQTTTFVGHHSYGDSSSGPVSFSPVSKCKNSPAMIPKIIVLKDLPHEMSALSAIPVFSHTLGSASASLTMISGVENPHRSQDGISLYHKEAFTTDWLNEDPAASEGRATVDHHPMFHRLRLQPEQESLLKVPEPVMVQNTNKIRQETSLATAAMETARHIVTLSNTSQFVNESEKLTRSLDFADSLTSQLMGADYIGEFERERARAHGAEEPGSNSTPSLSSSCKSFTTTVAMSQLLSSTGKLEDNDQYHPRRPEKIVLEKAMDKGYSSVIAMEDHHRGGSDSNNVSGGGWRKRQGSSQSDMSEKLLHLPEPSRLEGICSCRGMINVASMLFVMVGLVLMILGYPIAASLKKDRLEAEMQAMGNETMFTMSNHTAVNWTAHQPTVATTTTLIPSTTVVVLPKITANAVRVGLW